MNNYLRTELLTDHFIKLKFLHKVRIQPRQRNDDFSRSLQARILDPLWMIARQLQVGEFTGDDSGSPIKTKLAYKTRKITKYCINEPESPASVHPIESDTPLEYAIETWDVALNYMDRVRLGEIVQSMIGQEIEDNWIDLYIKDIKKNPIYCITPLNDDDIIDLDDSTSRLISVSAYRVLDAKKLIETGVLSDSPILPESSHLANSTDEQVVKIKKLLKKIFMQFVDGNFTQNSRSHPGWSYENLDYQFAVSSPKDEDYTKETVLVSRNYMQGELDWYSFSSARNEDLRLPDVFADVDEPEPVFETKEIEVAPTNISFRGMPNPRWWEFEDKITDFGDPTINVSEIGKLLTMQFSLIYANDWFIQPVTLNVGTICSIDEMKVKDVFGVETTINRAGTGRPERAVESWDMFSISVEQDNDITNSNNEGMKYTEKFFFLPPVLGIKQESKPVEELHLIRDEQANMSWTIENILESGMGNPISGFEEYLARMQRRKMKDLQKQIEALRELSAAMAGASDEISSIISGVSETLTPEALASAIEEAEAKLAEIRESLSDQGPLEVVPPGEKTIKYKLSTSVPGNWIPYLPVHVDNQNRQVQLRRAAMVSGADNDVVEIIKPKSQYLKMAGNDHRVNEETVSRAALKMQLTTQRARWINGETFVWRSWKINLGQGEGSSGLKFDYIDEG